VLGAGGGGFAPCYRAPPLMAAPPPVYDLMVLLDTAAPDDQRAKILSDVETMISNGGDVVGTHDWGARTMAYEIRHKPDAEYHLIQFHGDAELLATL
jgi:small subunit ribosomal protein S6